MLPARLADADNRISRVLSLALIASNAATAGALAHVVEDANIFKIVYRDAPATGPHALLRSLRIHDVDVILLDLEDWETVEPLADALHGSGLKAVVIGFRADWNRQQQLVFGEAGIQDLLRGYFSPRDLEATVYEALHRERPVANENILAFLPAKAGGGCSTVALHAAAALSALDNSLEDSAKKKVLLLESDRRSGVLSLWLNLNRHVGLSEALHFDGEMTGVEWQRYYVNHFATHMLLADPARRGPMPTWSDYYRLLQFLHTQYEYIVVDLPEIINQATAEVVRSARDVFIVCTPEVPSLKMAAQRCAALR